MPDLPAHRGAPALEARLAEIEQLLPADPDRAGALAGAVLADHPEEPLALLFRGIARRLAGDPGAAVEQLEALCSRWPEAAMAQLQLGLARREAGDFPAAADALRRAVAARPDFSDARLALADLLTTLGEKRAAAEAWAAYIDQAGGIAEFREAGAALRDGRLDEAESILRRQLAVWPNDVVALSLLADAAERRGRLVEAEQLLARAVEVAPAYARARHNLAAVLLRGNRAAEALAHSERLLADDPGNADHRRQRGAILVALHEYEQAIEIFRGLLEDTGNDAALWTSLGHLLKTVGRREEAVAAYRRAIDLAPRRGEAYWGLGNLKRDRLRDDELAAALARLEQPECRGEDRIHFHFAAGKGLEDRGRYAESFEHYAAGNRLRFERHPWDADAFSRHIQQLIDLQTREFFEQRRGSGSDSEAPIFVVGLPRSGSTLVEQILASHPQVEGTAELPEMGAAAASLDAWERGGDRPGYPAILMTLDHSVLREIGEAYVEQTRQHRKSGRPRFVDKMPNNFLHVGLIHLALPNARIVDVRRHPMACGLSLYREHFARAQNFAYSLESIGRYYRDYLRLMAHLGSVLPGRVHRVEYEHLVMDTESEIRQLLEYCGLDFDPACLRFDRNRRAVNTASAEQVRRPVYRDALNQWRKFEPWLAPLAAALESPLAS